MVAHASACVLPKPRPQGRPSHEHHPHPRARSRSRHVFPLDQPGTESGAIESGKLEILLRQSSPPSPPRAHPCPARRSKANSSSHSLSSRENTRFPRRAQPPKNRRTRLHDACRFPARRTARELAAPRARRIMLHALRRQAAPSPRPAPRLTSLEAAAALTHRAAPSRPTKKKRFALDGPHPRRRKSGELSALRTLVRPFTARHADARSISSRSAPRTPAVARAARALPSAFSP